MLAALRDRSAGLVAKTLLALLILSFAVWGIGDMVGGRSSGAVVAEVGDVDISAQSFNSTFDREVRRLQSTLSPEIDRERARAFGLDIEVLQRLVAQNLLAAGAADLGVSAPDDAVAATVRSMKTFQVGGVFDRQRFSEILYSSGLSENGYFELVRGDLIRAQYMNPLTGAADASKVLADALYAYQNETRSAETLFIASAAQTSALPAEADIVKFHTDNAARFTAPEYRALSVLYLTTTDAAREVEVTDADIQAAYDEHQADYATPETRKLRQMVIADEAKAKTAAERLAQGADFAQIAKEVAGMNAGALDLGDVERGHLLGEMADPVFTAKSGDVVGPIKSPLGWHLVAVDAITPAAVQPLEAVRAKLKSSIASDRAIDALYKLVNQVEDALGGGATLAEAAKAINMDLLKIPAIDRTGKTPTGDAPAKMPTAPSFLSTAFATTEGEDSLLVEAGNDGFFVLRVDGVTPPALKDLDVVRADVISALMDDARDQAAKAKAEQAMDMAKAGQSFAAIAQATGGAVKSPAPFNRTTQDLPGSLVDALFAAKVGESAMAGGQNGYTVARLTAVNPAKKNSADSAKMADALADGLRNDLLAQLTNGLRARHPVSVNQNALNALFTSGN